MSARTTNPLIKACPPKPAEITLDTLPQLFAHYGAVFGGATMTSTPPEPPAPTPPPPAPTPPAPSDPPEGVSKEEWDALGDPGRTALSREREARTSAERALAAARARPAPPAQPAAPGAPPSNDPPAPGDIEAIVQRAVEAAVKPFQDREEQRDASVAVQRIQQSVADAAKDTFHDTSDAIAGVDLTKVTDGNGNADPVKVKEQLDALLVAKPHLGKVPDGRLYAMPGVGGGPSSVPLETRVQEILGRMSSHAGIKTPTTPTT